ncbi:MAG TPA: hypothetical protein VFZ10_03485 [Geminicoccaceae bacterium]
MSVTGRPSRARRALSAATSLRAAVAALSVAAQARAIGSGEDGEDAVADQLENVAALRMDRRDDDVGIVVEQRNHLLGRGIGDAREAAQVAEPDHGVDALGDAADDAAAEHAPSGVTAEIGLHQCPDHAGERGRLDGQRKRRHQARERGDIGLGEAAGLRSHPRGVDAIHLTDDAFGPEAVDHRDVVGHARGPVVPQDGKLGRALRGHAAPQQALPGLRHTEERTCAPAYGHVGLLAAGGEL